MANERMTLKTPTKVLNAAMRGADYVSALRRDYSLYVMQARAVVSEADGLKPAARRLLYTGRDGATIKTQNLAAQTMPLHPHGAPDEVANTLAAPYGNNIPLLQGIGLFGTYLSPKAYGATRYTDVKLSKFTKDVVFADFDIIPMVPNYDMTRDEPKHFLPLVPVGMLNASEGIAVGFSSAILPRSLQDVITQQVAFLEGKKVKDVMPYSAPNDCRAVSQDDAGRWEFHGEYEKIAHNVIRVTKLPVGVTYEKYLTDLTKLVDAEKIIDYDDTSKDSINIKVTFKRGQIATYTDAQMLKLLNLIKYESERIIMVTFDGQTVVERGFVDTIKTFTEWRLQWYVTRYEFLRNKHQTDLQYVIDYLLTVDKGMPATFTAQKTKAALEEALRKIGVVNDERIARLPAYSFAREEYDKMVARKAELEGQIKMCNDMLNDETLRKAQYIAELKEVLASHKQGKYATKV